MTDEPIIGMYEVLEAVEEVIKTADRAKRTALVATIDGYRESFPDEFFWATGVQAPSLLYHLVTSIDMSCRSEATTSDRFATKEHDSDG